MSPLEERPRRPEDVEAIRVLDATCCRLLTSDVVGEPLVVPTVVTRRRPAASGRAVAGDGGAPMGHASAESREKRAASSERDRTPSLA